MSHEMEIFLFKNHYPTSLVMDSLSLYTSKEIYITNNLYKHIREVI